MDPFVYLSTLETLGIKFGLDNIRTLCAALGSPQAAYQCVLVAGTNGKGSVTALLDTALRAAGLKVGRYTSPHLIRLEERFAIDGEPVATAVLREVVDRVRVVTEGLQRAGGLSGPPTYFEATTAVGFELFRRAGVQMAVLEVGLGGRLDSTNVADPVAGAITTIDFDHEQYLGHTLAAIAAEKAGIIRPGMPLVVGETKQEPLAVIAAACAKAGARLIRAEADIHLATEVEDGRTSIELRTPRRAYGRVALGLRGAHQVQNALVAVRLLEELEAVGAEAIVTGLRDVRWPGRLELIETAPSRRVLLDSAHNPSGACALAAYLADQFPERLPMVFAAMRDKAAASMLDVLLPRASAVVFTETRQARTRPPWELAVIARAKAPHLSVEVDVDPAAALERAWSHGSTVCAAGSIFLVGELLALVGRDARVL